MKKIKKRKAPLQRELKLYQFIYEKYKKKKEFENCNVFFDWVEKQIKLYNKNNKTRFNETYILKYVSWKATEDLKR